MLVIFPSIGGIGLLLHRSALHQRPILFARTNLLRDLSLIQVFGSVNSDLSIQWRPLVHFIQLSESNYQHWN
jgi:hypothetical protein